MSKAAIIIAMSACKNITPPPRNALAANADDLRKGELLYLIHDLSRLISLQFDRIMAPKGLTHAQWWALMHVMLNEGQSQSEIARFMQLGRSAAGKTFDRLESKNWIERHPDPNDQRLVRVFLAQGARPAVQEIINAGPSLFHKLLADITKEEELMLLERLRKIQSNAS